VVVVTGATVVVVVVVVVVGAAGCGFISSTSTNVPVDAGPGDDAAVPSPIVSVSADAVRAGDSSRPPNGSPISSRNATITTPMITSGTIHQ